MLKTVNGQGRYVMVNGGMPSHTYVNSYSGAQGVGNVRFNTSTQNFEVFDGSSWIQINSSHASVGLTPEAEDAVTWAINKLHEERMLELKAKDNPAIADLLNQRKTIDEQIKVIEILTRDNKVGTN